VQGDLPNNSFIKTVEVTSLQPLMYYYVGRYVVDNMMCSSSQQTKIPFLPLQNNEIRNHVLPAKKMPEAREAPTHAWIVCEECAMCV
jgi:hypothetical protein